MGDFVAFQLGSFAVTWRGIIMATAMLMAMAICVRDEKWLGLPDGSMLNLGVFAVLLCAICSRAFFVVFSLDSFQFGEASVFDFLSGGNSLYGAGIGGAIALFIYSRASRIPVGRLAEACAAPVALAISIGRWGDFANQESFGPVVADMAFARFPIAQYIDRLGEWHYAVFFFESFGCLLLFAYLMGRRGQLKQKGDSMLFFMLYYGALRSFLESLREDSLYVGFVRVSQLCSLLIVLAAIAAFSARALKHRPVDGQDVACWASAVMLVATAVLCEFFMGAQTLALNRTLLFLAMVMMCVIGTMAYRRIDERAQEAAHYFWERPRQGA